MNLNFFVEMHVLMLLCRKNGVGAYTVSAHLGKQHINLVNPIIIYTSLFITGALTNDRKRNFKLQHRNTEDQLFQHNSLSAIIFSTLDAGPSCSTQNLSINGACCDKQQPRV
jgi:hypothetical protein